MRIGVNCFPLRAHIGGLKQYFWNLFNYLLENDTENEYVFFCFEHNREQLACLASRRWEKSAIYLESQESIAKHFGDIDLYFCPFNILWPRPVPVPAVMTLVDVQEVAFPQFFTAPALLDRAFHLPGSTRAADRVITISEYSKESICRAHEISRDKVIVAYLCADQQYFQSDSNGHNEDLPAPFEEYLFYPANRWLHKNHDRLLRAMRILNLRQLSVNAVFTGFDVPGSGYPLREKACEYGLGNRVHVAGYVSLQQMTSLYRKARMLAYPSLFEGFGMPVVEAMAAGCPVVASNTTALPEICAGAALHFDPSSDDSIAEAIEFTWRDHSLRTALIERGRKRAIAFSPSRLGEAHLRAFREAHDSFSRLRYRWHRHVYQRYHYYNVHFRYLTSTRFGNGAHADTCSVFFASGWYHREQSGSFEFRWTNGRARFRLQVPRPMRICIETKVMSARMPNAVHLVLNGKEVATWNLDGNCFEFHPVPRITVDIPPGRNVIDLVSRESPMSSASDSRKLAVAFQNLTIKDSSGADEFQARN